MAKAFKPSTPYTTAIELLIPTYTSSFGTPVKTYPAQGERINCSFKTYQGTSRGTEAVRNDVFVVLDTATVETWYRPDIKSDCRIKVLATGKQYEIINEPENIDMRNQFLKFMVRGVDGRA